MSRNLIHLPLDAGGDVVDVAAHELFADLSAAFTEDALLDGGGVDVENFCFVLDRHGGLPYAIGR
ncbi:hypothetical protein [Nocardia vaccinii]|uniref:hypothetical protein n=1 Tax=Nocardia vaccinii TaxID=1822 RepID=UPI001C3FA1F7|nr:hypothetical protein [Nocardia vaccinii]